MQELTYGDAVAGPSLASVRPGGGKAQEARGAAPTKHELKTKETRKLLLAAAEKIFVRDGYEKADLGEIASEAGRTKGAIYGHFESKEEVFLALVEAQAMKRRAALERLLTPGGNAASNLAAMRSYVEEFAAHDAWGLLLLEYRLFVVRYPEAEQRFARTYAAILPVDEEKRYTDFLGPASKAKGSLTRTTAVHAMFSALAALQLAAKYDPRAVPPGEIGKIAVKIFDALFSA